VIQAVLEIAATGKAENNIISDIREKSEEAGLRLNDTSKDAVFERLGITKDGIRSHEFGKRRDKKPEKESRRTPARSLHNSRTDSMTIRDNAIRSFETRI